MNEIPEQFIDIEGDGGTGNFTGCAPRTDEPGDNHELFGNSFAAIPRSEWQEQDDDVGLVGLVSKILNQKNEGSCAGFATVQAFQLAWNMAYGKDNFIEISGTSIYKACGRSPNSGSTISCCLKRLREVGCLPVPSEANLEFMRLNQLNTRHVLNAVGFHQRWPQDYQQTANYFRAAETYDVRSFDEMATAMLQGFPVVYGRKGHAICACNLRRVKGQWGIKYANSWGSWGDNGFGYDTESYVSRELRSYGAIAVRCTVNPDFRFRS